MRKPATILSWIYILLISISGIHAQNLYDLPNGMHSRVSSFENINGIPGKGGLTNNGSKGNAFESIKAGETQTLLHVQEPGIINRIWLTVSNRSPLMLRSLRLRMYWDGQIKPAVDVPLGDFFCAGLGIPVAFQSELFTNPEGRSFNCYIPMPFKKAARITITNESTTDLASLFFDIDFMKLTKAPVNMLYFHACWNRAIRAPLGKDFELLPAIQGRGRFLGVNVGVHVDSVYGQTWWGEGEVKIYLDGDNNNPTINGTGAEDYIGTGWGEGKFANMFQGCTIADGDKGQYTFYRFHVPDPVYFYHGIKATIQEMGGGTFEQVKTLEEKGVLLKPVSVSTEKKFIRLFETPKSLRDADFPPGWVNFYRVDDYSATAYFYLENPVSSLPGLISVEERIK